MACDVSGAASSTKFTYDRILNMGPWAVGGFRSGIRLRSARRGGFLGLPQGVGFSFFSSFSIMVTVADSTIRIGFWGFLILTKI